MTNRFSSASLSIDHKFCGETVKIRKLTVNQVDAIQVQAKIVEAAKDTEDHGKASRDLLELMLRSGVAEFETFTTDDFGDLPIDELSKLSNAIMKHSGFGK